MRYDEDEHVDDEEMRGDDDESPVLDFGFAVTIVSGDGKR